MTDEVSQALENLQAIKNGEDPTESGESTAATTTTPDVPAQANEVEPVPESGHAALDDLRRIIRKTFFQNPWLSEHILQKNVHAAVADWPRRRGQAKYNQRPTEHVFGERVPGSKIKSDTGEYTVLIAIDIYEKDLEWEDTVKHEIAHCVAHAMYDEYPKRTRNGTSNGHPMASHGPKWKEVAKRLGAKPSSCGPRKNEDRKPYRFACPNGCWDSGKVRRSKKVQRPWTRHCKTCGADCVSYDAGDDRPTEEGVCAVESIKWDGREEYIRSDKEL